MKRIKAEEMLFLRSVLGMSPGNISEVKMLDKICRLKI
jgi:hypothetical protein